MTRDTYHVSIRFSILPRARQPFNEAAVEGRKVVALLSENALDLTDSERISENFNPSPTFSCLESSRHDVCSQLHPVFELIMKPSAKHKRLKLLRNVRCLSVDFSV